MDSGSNAFLAYSSIITFSLEAVERDWNGLLSSWWARTNFSWIKEDVCLNIFRTSALMSEPLSNVLLDVRKNWLVAIWMDESLSV